MFATPRLATRLASRLLPALTFALASAFAPAASAQVTFDNGCLGNSNWDCAQNWDGDTVPADGDDVVIGSFTVTGTFTATTLNSLSLSGTTLNTDGTLSVGDLDWSGGLITTGAVLTITGTGSEWSGTTKTLSGVTLSIASGGEVAHTAGNLNFSAGAVLENAGLYDVQGDDDLDDVTGNAEFVNEATGTFRKSAGAGETTFDVLLTNEGGTVDVQTGEVHFTRSGALTGGTYAAAAATTLLFDAGTFTASGTLTGDPAGSVGHDAGAAFAAPAGATLDFGNEGYQWAGGSVSAPGAGVVTNADLLVLDGSTHSLSGSAADDVVLRNEGTVRHTAAALNFSAGAVLENAGLYDVQGDDDLDDVTGNAEFVNEATGTFRKSAGAGETTFDVLLTNEGGTVDVQTGEVHFTRSGALTGGTYAAAAATTLLFDAGTFTASGTLTGDPAGSVGHDAGAAFAAPAGATLDFGNEGYQWAGGSVSAPGAGVVTNADLLVLDGSTHSLSGSAADDVVLRNEGTVRHTAAALNFSAGAVLENAGLYDVQGDDDLDDVTGNAEFVNEATGTFRKSAGAGETTFDVLLTNEGGTVDVQTGEVHFTRSGALTGGTYAAAAATTLLFDAGTFTASGTLTGDPAGSVGHDAGATLTAADGTTGTLDFGGMGYQWAGSSITAPGTGVIVNADLLVLDGSPHSLSGSAAGDVVLRNEGTVRHTAAALNFSAGAVLENAGLYDVQGDDDLDDVTGNAEFVNEATGTFRKSAGANTTTVDVQTTNEAGGTILANSGLLDFTRGLDNQADGMLGGIASLSPSPTNPYVNDGIIAPGASPGVLDFQAALTQSASAALSIEIAGNGGAGAADGHDQLQATGDATLDGEISVSLLDDFLPNDGDEYVVLTASSVSGEFSNPNSFDRIYVGDGVAFTVIYELTQVKLVADILQAELALAKTVDGEASTSVDVGTEVTFEVTLSNTGPDDLSEFGLDENIVVADALPAGLSLVSATESAGTYDDTEGTWTVASLPSGSSATLTLVASVDDAGTFTNTATITSSVLEDPDASNDTASAEVTGQAADLRVEKSASPEAVEAGVSFTYVITLTNDGPDAAEDITVEDAVPAGLSCSAIASAGTYTAADDEWTLAALASGDDETLTFTCSAAATGTYTNTATRTASSPVDLNADNDSDSATVTVTAPGEADLALTKTVDEDEPTVGDQVTFTVTITNNGPEDATDVEVSDPEPEGLTFDSVTSESGGIYDDGTGVWSIPSLPSGSSLDLTIVATVDRTGVSTNTATVSASSEPDSNTDNNTASATVDGQPAVVISACTTASPLYISAFAAGSPGSATVRNSSADDTVALDQCTLAVFDGFDEVVEDTETAPGPLAPATSFVYAPTIEAGRPGAVILSTAALENGDGVSDAVGSVVAAVVFDATGAVFGECGDGPAGAQGDPGLAPCNSPAGAASVSAALAALFGGAVAGEDGGAVDLDVAVWPNPSDRAARVGFGLAEAGDARVSVVDALGREVAVLADGPRAAGRHDVALGAAALPAGLYVVRVAADGAVRTARLTVAR